MIDEKKGFNSGSYRDFDDDMRVIILKIKRAMLS